MLDNFQFSQASLQDYSDCPRRFELKYIKHLSWPAVEANPVSEYEKSLYRGNLFHKIVYQHLIGIQAHKLSEMITDIELKKWWNNYLEYEPFLTGERYPEILLSTSIGPHILMAKYDLILIREGRAIIIDWKTSHKKQKRDYLSERLQTKTYLYLLAAGGNHINHRKNILPEEVHMIYWFANYPYEEEIFYYDKKSYKEGGEYLLSLIEEITKTGKFPMTDNIKKCSFCMYRSLCSRGIKAGDTDGNETEFEHEDNIEFDFDQIGEIEF